MDHKQFMSAIQFPRSDRRSSTYADGGGYSYRDLDHPVDNYPIVSAEGPTLSTTPPLGDVTSSRATGSNYVVGWPHVVGFRDGAAASDIKLAIGLRLRHALDNEHRHKVLDLEECGGLIYCGAETAPAYKGTARLRARWALAATTTPVAVEEFRVKSLIGYDSDHFVHLYRELPPNHDEPPNAERDESALTGRTAAFAATDKLHLAVPWLHEDNEIVITVPLSGLHMAVAKVKALLTPTPAPTDD